MEVPSDWAEDQEQEIVERVLKYREPLESATTLQEFVNELDLAMNYQEPAKRKYDNRGQVDPLIVLFEYVLQALFSVYAWKKSISVLAPEMERKMENKIGKRIKEMRKKKGMTQELLAEAMLTDKSTISLYENDKIDIKSSVLIELAKVLGCTAGYLLEGENQESIDAEFLSILSRIKNPEVKAIALKQLEALAMIEQV